MALSKQERIERQSYIGGSDVSAILGLNRYRNITDVWLEKTKRLEVTDEAPSRPADLGDRLEPALVQLAADTLGHSEVVFNHRFTHPEPGQEYKSAQADGWLPDVGEVIEAKALGLFNRMFDTSEWGEEGTDEVPYEILVQVVWQLHVADAKVGHISALLGGGLGHRLYTVEYRSDLATKIEKRVDAFWHKNVLADVAPDVPASLSTYKDVIREPAKMAEVSDDLPFQYEVAQQATSEAKKHQDAVKAEVLRQMGDAEVGYSPFGHFSYKADKNGKRTFRLHAGQEGR